MSEVINRRLNASRKELLDIGLRNNMISFRKSTKTLLLVDEISEEVFNILYLQNKKMSFSSMEKSKLAKVVQSANSDFVSDNESIADTELIHELDGIDWSLVEENDQVTKTGKLQRHVDSKLQTMLDDERLFLQLLKIHSEAKGFIEEQGVNILFLALGFMHWYESESSDVVRKAPLVLLPVLLNRSSARDAFSLEYSGDDLIDNLSLGAKLKTDFSLEMPGFNIDPDQADDSIDLNAYFAEVSKAIFTQKRWRIAPNEMALGFFSFGKFLMFKDLDPKSWPEDKQPGNHIVVNRLLGKGFGDISSAYSEGVHIDSVIVPGDVRFVKDADSSQTEAILEVRAGSNLVIQGPPGTGKSQTITNLIAELVGQKKTVLFVAEKLAALEVVKRRLDESHLGDAVLELHSHKSTKQSVLKELQRTLGQGRPLNLTGKQDVEDLKQLQDSLNQYCEAVSSGAGASGLPFVEVLGKYLKLKRNYTTLPTISFEPMASWTYEVHLKRRELVRELAMHIREMGRPRDHVFWGTECTFFSPIEENKANDILEMAGKHLSKLQVAISDLSKRLMLSHPANLHDVAIVCRAARRASEAPRLDGVRISIEDWQLRRDAVRDLLHAGAQMCACRNLYDSQLVDLAWDQNLLEIRTSLQTYGDKWWKILSARYRAANTKLQGLARGKLPQSTSEMLKIVDSVLTYQQHRKIYDQNESLGGALFGAQWQGKKSDWAVLERLSRWVIQLHDDLGKGEIPSGIVEFLSGHPNASGLGDEVKNIEQCVVELSNALKMLLETTGMGSHVGHETIREKGLNELAVLLASWLENLPKLHLVARYNVLAEHMHSAGLGELLNVAASSDSPNQLIPILDLSWYSGLVQQSYATQPALRQFDRIQHEYKIGKFRELDLASLQHAQTSLAKQVWECMPNINQPGEMVVLRVEMNKKRKHIPIRQLISKAGRAIQQFKPVFMMSPMSIANFLPAGRLDFDVVIFDEASQVKAIDAFGAILRGKQVVVVGDTKQMPPSDFFSRDVELDDEENATGDVESILSMFKVAGCSERYLRWHYRSRHESLIAVSNVEFYDSKLVVFPSAGQHLHAKGVSFQYLPHSIYDRGRTRTNKDEAKAVAQAVIEHARKTPHLSLGVAAFSVAQRDLIQIEVELLRRKMPEAEKFFTQKSSESFFIKNLENVQGDERDVIFISIGYGRNESGKIAKEFGPLNREGGHRRLNVLITRAKLAMKVFCNFRADDLELDANAVHGVRALKNFLKFAETGQLEVAHETGKAADSPFELEVIEALRERNFSVEPQVGTAGYFIDMAVKDPDYPGRYLLAIECDGAAYHSSRSARDRDRLRQGVLEGLGWTFHRIWSTDWFRNRNQEIARTIAAIESARKNIIERGDEAMQKQIPVFEHEHKIIRDVLVDQNLPATSNLYIKAVLPSMIGHPFQIHEVQENLLADLIHDVAEIESPVHETEVTRRIMGAFGVTRAGARIAASIENAIKNGVRRQLFCSRDGFIYSNLKTDIQPRNRSQLEASERKIECVAPEEIDVALLETIRLGFSMLPDDAIAGALGLLGFGRATSKVTEAIDSRLHKLISEGQLSDSNGMLACAS